MSEENKRKASERMKAMHEKKATQTPPPVEEPKVPAPVDMTAPVENSTPREKDLEKQVNELKDMMLKFMSGAQNNQGNGLSVGNNGKLVGEVEKYTVNPLNYTDPTVRLKQEPRLQPMAFNLNYELEYEMSVRPYETKTGVNQKEPEFLVTLLRVVLDDQGIPTEKRYIARRMVFHEDPQAAIVIARDNGISLDEYKDMDNTDANQKLFLNEMRYLRVRDWLFGIFWPKPADNRDKVREEVIGGTIVQVLTKSSEEAAEIDFSKINQKF